MMIETKEFTLDRQYWDIVKGIAILCVIIGHTCMWAQHYIYLFHLQVFFYASGYFYSEKKYGDRPLLNAKNKLKNLWLPYAVLYIIAILLHNPLIDMGLQPSTYEKYSVIETISKILLAVTGNGAEVLLGPAWFLPVLAISAILLGFIIYISRLVEKWTGSFLLKLLVQLIPIIVMAVVGYPMVLNHVKLFADIQLCFEIIPFIYMGYFCRNYIGDICKYLDPVLGLIAALITFYISRFEWVDVTIGHVFKYMYICCAIAIYMCLCLAAQVKNVAWINRVFEYMGINSMAIMIIHFIVLRVFDKFLTLYIFHDVSGQLYDRLPVAFEELWPVYLVFVVPVTLICVMIWNGIKFKVRENLWKKNK